MITTVSDIKWNSARVAQLVEHNLAKVGAAGSSPVSRFFLSSQMLVLGIEGFLFVKRKKYAILVTVEQILEL